MWAVATLTPSSGAVAFSVPAWRCPISLGIRLDVLPHTVCMPGEDEIGLLGDERMRHGLKDDYALTDRIGDETAPS